MVVTKESSIESLSAITEDEFGRNRAGSKTEPVDGVLDNGTSDSQRKKQTIDDVLILGEEPTEEFLAEFVALNEAPPVPDEELEKQALSHPGEDGDPGTPE